MKELCMYRTIMMIVKKHPLTSAVDLCLFTGTMVIATCLAVAYDMESFWNDLSPRQRSISELELLGLSILFIGGISLFIWRRILEEKQDAVQRAAAQRELDYHRSLAMADMLTTLPNRRAFTAALDQAYVNGRPFALFLMDLNGFKLINDRFGHPVGDRVLQEIAGRFKDATRAVDTVARIGGDEFAVIAEVETPSAARPISARFLNAVRDAVVIDGQDCHVGVAIGIALWPAHGETAQDILRCADIALYEAKKEKVSAVRIYQDPRALGRLRAISFLANRA
jgi:diguanylate cyclase (GGDEF)-like protein